MKRNILALLLALLCAFSLSAAAETYYDLTVSVTSVNNPYERNAHCLLSVDGINTTPFYLQLYPDGQIFEATYISIPGPLGDKLFFNISGWNPPLPEGYTCIISPASYTPTDPQETNITLNFTLTFTKATPATPSGSSAEPYTEPAPPPEGQPATVTGVTTSANVRANPSLDADIIGQVSPNEASA